MASNRLGLYAVIGRKEIIATPPRIAAPGFTKQLLPPYSSPDGLWESLRTLPGWKEHAPDYQGRFGFGGGAYISAQKDANGVTFALSFGEGFIHIEDIGPARQTLTNFEALLAYGAKARTQQPGGEDAG